MAETLGELILFAEGLLRGWRWEVPEASGRRRAFLERKIRIYEEFLESHDVKPTEEIMRQERNLANGGGR